MQISTYRQSRWETSASLILLIVVIGLVTPFVIRPLWFDIKFSMDWRAEFAPYQDIGDQCVVSMNPPLQDASPDAYLAKGRLEAKPFRVPFRSEPRYKSTPNGYWVYVGCEFTANPSERYTSPLLYLGPIFGDSAVYLNGVEVRRFSEYAQVKLHLNAEQLKKPIKVEIVSMYDGVSGGPASLLPVVVLPSEQAARKIDRALNYSSTEKTLVPLGIAGTMMALFLCCWIFGVRYRDVYWMIVACTAAAGSAAMLHAPDYEPSIAQERFRLVIEMICWSSLWVAIYTFLRKPGRQWHFILFVLVIVGLYQMQFLVPPDIRKALIGGIDRHDGVWIGAVLIALSVMCFRIGKDIPRRRYLQRRILGSILMLFGIWVVWAGFYAFRIGFSFSTTTRAALIGTFGIFMMIDLVIFQRAYFEEKSLKEEEERRRLALEDRMELGFSIQRLLMPAKQLIEFGPFRVQVFYECADLMAGDWFYWKESSDDLKVFCGDVVGKGPQAAIAATSVLTMCHDLSSTYKSIEAMLKHLNKSAAELFQMKSISTIGAAGLKKDGSVQIINHGFAGWIHLSANSVELINQRGSLLGSSLDMEWNSKDVQMKVGDRLIIFSDGVLEGPRALKRVCEELAKMNDKPFAEITAMVREIGKNSVIEDDRTLVMIERLV